MKKIRVYSLTIQEDWPWFPTENSIRAIKICVYFVVIYWPEKGLWDRLLEQAYSLTSISQPLACRDTFLGKRASRNGTVVDHTARQMRNETKTVERLHFRSGFGRSSEVAGLVALRMAVKYVAQTAYRLQQKSDKREALIISPRRSHRGISMFALAACCLLFRWIHSQEPGDRSIRGAGNTRSSHSRQGFLTVVICKSLSVWEVVSLKIKFTVCQ
jgi:hypothetical protein